VQCRDPPPSTVKEKKRGIWEAIAKLGNDRAGHEPSLMSRVWIFWPAISFFSHDNGSRTKGRNERAVKTTSELYANCHYIIRRPRCVYLSVEFAANAKLGYNGLPLFGKRKSSTQGCSDSITLHFDQKYFQIGMRIRCQVSLSNN